jgi:sulfur carrier protein ThiS
LFFINVFAQNKNGKYLTSSYPEGYYTTLEDFIEKKTSPLGDVTRIDVKSYEIISDEELVDQFFFMTLPDSSKLKKVFAVSFNGNLYIRQAYFTKYASKGDRVSAANNPNSYHLVLMDGNFFYMECVFANTWKTGVGYKLGVAGSGLASSAYQLKLIILNFETKKFDLFRNCEDFNFFLNSINSDSKVDCETRYIPLEKIKSILSKEIKK